LEILRSLLWIIQPLGSTIKINISILHSMLAKLKKLATTETGKDTFIVFWGTILNVIIGGIFFIIAPRLLGPTNYGLFATVYTTSVLTVRLTSLGIDTGILRFTNSLSKDSNAFLVIALKWYLFLGIAAGVVGYIISPKLAHILAQPSITNLLRIAFASTILFHLTNLFTAGLQAKREFKKAAIMLIANNTSRLLLLIAGSYFFIINLYLLTLTFFLSAIASVIIGGFFMPFEITKINRDLEKKFFKFNIWIWLSLTLSAIPFDNYLLLKIAGPLQTGLYAAPFKFLNYAYQIGGNFTAVLASRFSSFENDSKAKIFSHFFIFHIILGPGNLTFIWKAVPRCGRNIEDSFSRVYFFLYGNDPVFRNSLLFREIQYILRYYCFKISAVCHFTNCPYPLKTSYRCGLLVYCK